MKSEQKNSYQQQSSRKRVAIENARELAEKKTSRYIEKTPGWTYNERRDGGRAAMA